MANYQLLKADIDAKVYENTHQEITGANLNAVLNAMVTTLGAGYQFAEVATIDTNPGTPDAKVFYIANGKGTYTNFGGLEVTEDEVVVLYWDSSWHKVSTGIASQAKLSELESNLKVGDVIFENNSFITYANNSKIVYRSEEEAGLYFCDVNNLTSPVNISLYKNGILLQEDILILDAANKFGYFKAEQSFDEIRIWSLIQQTISFKLYSYIDENLSKRVSNLEKNAHDINDSLDTHIYNRYIKDFDLEEGNITSHGKPSPDTKNIRSAKYTRIPYGSNYVWVNNPLANSYHLTVFFYDENEIYISYFEVYSHSSTQEIVPSNAAFYKILIWDRPDMITVVNSNICFSFIIRDKFLEREFTEKIDDSTITIDECLFKNVYFTVQGQKEVLKSDSFEVNKKYLINISGNTGLVYVNLFNDTALVKENVAIVPTGGGKTFFESDIPFNEISIYTSDVEHVSLSLYSISEHNLTEKFYDAEQDIGTINYLINDKCFDTKYYQLVTGNIANGFPESTKNVITSYFYEIPPAVKVRIVLDSWSVAVVFYSSNTFNSYISTIEAKKNIDILIPPTAKYYRLIFFGSTLPTIADIKNDGATINFITKSKLYAEETRALVELLVTDSYLEARKHYNIRNIIIKPIFNLNRENGNIIWKQDKRLCQNPLTTVDTPDPTVVKIGNYYYMACTGFPIKIYRSDDMVNWEFYRNVFPGTSNNPFNDGSMSGNLFGMGVGDLNYWAPSMFVLNNKVYLYIYTIAGNYAIAATQLVVADNIDGTFSWVGTVHQSGLDDNQFRDTQFFKDTNGDVYISTGDASSNAKRIAKMSSDLITVESSWKINGVEHEGTLLYKYNGYYYLFFSGGRTDMYTYDVRCFRSRDITLSTWEDLGILLKQQDEHNPLNSTGHVGEIIEDKDGKLFMYMHCHCYGLTDNDSIEYGKRYLYLHQIIFDENDVPHFVDYNEKQATKEPQDPQWFIRCPNV